MRVGLVNLIRQVVEKHLAALAACPQPGTMLLVVSMALMCDPCARNVCGLVHMTMHL